MKDEALQEARAAIKAGGSAKYQGKVHTSLATLPKSADDEEGTSPDVTALLAEKDEIIKDLRGQVTEAINETGKYSDQKDDLQKELDLTKSTLDKSADALVDKTEEATRLEADNAKLKAEITKLHADNEKLKAENARLNTKAEPSPATPTATPAASTTPTTPASTKNT